MTALEKEEKKYIKYPIKDVTGRTRFIAKIFCKESDKDSYKKRLAVLWAIENKKSLSRLDLRKANLGGLNLSRFDLSYTDLGGANLRWANLSGANLSGADLSEANLSGANLSGANLSGADLSEANLSGANLSRALFKNTKLNNAYLGHANLSRALFKNTKLNNAYLGHANLSKAIIKNCNFENTSFFETIGDGKYIKNYKNNLLYSVAYTCDYLYIGCKGYSVKEWEDFTDREIIKIGGRCGLKWWKENKNKILKHIKDNPAKNWKEN